LRFRYLPIHWLAACVASVVAGCAVAPDPFQPTLRGIWQSFGSKDNSVGVKLNPALRYLRVTIDGQVSLFVLGELDADPRHAANPDGALPVPTEVWYSGTREVVRLRDGRVTGVSGFTPEWRNVELRGAPAWAQLAGRNDAVAYSRLRDVMPGYRYGINDALSIRRTPMPARSQLAGIEAASLAWFEETMVGVTPANAGDAALPPARYAVELRAGQATVVYGEQCLAKAVCFTWQRWPPDAARTP
jgi:hypothetical protein